MSNLPYTATSVDLETLFSDIAPVRSAFVVTEQGTGVSKGVGYVSFALKEDAESAYETLSKDGLTLVGRKMRIQWAESKVRAVKDIIIAYLIMSIAQRKGREERGCKEGAETATGTPTTS